MRREGLHLPVPQRQGQRLDSSAGVGEHQALLAAVEAGDDLGGVVERAHPVQAHLGLLPAAAGVDNCAVPVASGAAQPSQQLVGIPHRRREADPLQRPPGDGLEPGEDSLQVPASIVPGERVDLVHHDRPQVREHHLR